jgi:hypothetical protein
LSALSVSSVSAVTATTVAVTLNHAPSATDTLTYTFNGTAVAAANVSVTGAVATLTVPTMIDTNGAATNPTNPYVVVVSNAGTAINTSTIYYNNNQITTLAVQTSDLNKQIGNEMSLSVRMTNEDGVVMANKAVKLEAAAAYEEGGFETANTLTATTDENGIATFAWTRNHAGTEILDIYAVDRPIIRTAANITWMLAATNLVTVDVSDAVTLGVGTAKVYNVTAKNANGSNLAGNLLMNIAVGGGLAVGNLTTQVWNSATQTWGAPTAGNGTAQVTQTLIAANNGQVRFRVYNAAGTTGNFVPTFFYDIAGGNAVTLDNNEPRAVGSQVTYVAQVQLLH